jgi:hypothetical protein
VISVATAVVSVNRFAPSEMPIHSFLALQRTLPRCIIDGRFRYLAKPVLAISAGMPQRSSGCWPEISPRRNVFRPKLMQRRLFPISQICAACADVFI